MANYLVLSPLILLQAYVINLVFSATSPANEQFASIILGILFVLLSAIILLWLCWFYSIVHSVDEDELGLPVRWFYMALGLLLVYLLFTFSYSFFESASEDGQHALHALGEFVASGGILIAYPLLCHYAARALVAKKTNQPASFIRAIPFTLLLFFGAVLAIPFLQKYVSTKSSSNSEIIKIYAIAFGLFFLALVIGFLASVSGLV